jgi:hypothetical protein
MVSTCARNSFCILQKWQIKKPTHSTTFIDDLPVKVATLVSQKIKTVPLELSMWNLYRIIHMEGTWRN